MGGKVKVACCALNQWAMDFEGNYKRILLSLRKAIAEGATIRSGPELEITGYGCGDHFLEADTCTHAWEVVADLIKNPVTREILYDVGMPVLHKNLLYNCRVVLYNRRIILIRPKMILANNGCYRETRWFTAWQKVRQTEDHYLPPIIRDITNQQEVPFGDALVQTLDTCVGYEICDELWNPDSPHISMSLDGAEIFVNGSGSYTEIRKGAESAYLMKSATAKCGGCYIFSNQKGCDGESVYYPGDASIAVNGEIVSAADPYTLTEVDVVCATIDLEAIRSYINKIRSRSHNTVKSEAYTRVPVNFSLGDDSNALFLPSQPIDLKIALPEEEVLYGPSCWLWDYLRRSGQGGFLLPLSGGVDSAANAVSVYSMCTLVVEAIEKGNKAVLEDVRRILDQGNYIPKTARDLCNQLLHTVYLSTENSSKKSKERSKKLAKQIGSYHLPMAIDAVVSAVVGIFSTATTKIPTFRVQGGSSQEDLALQHVQARSRMVCSYFFAQLLLWVRGRTSTLLVLGSSNVDKCLRGHLPKYDCSSADINPIGGFSKTDLQGCLILAKERLNLPVLGEILEAVPSGELEPLIDGEPVREDVDEDMGMTYDELATFGKLRKEETCGPYSMYLKLMNIWANIITPEKVAEKVKNFFRYYSMNRHKMTVLSPTYHVGSYSSDDHRFDHRPFLYNVQWNRQFTAIDRSVSALARPPVVHTKCKTSIISEDYIEESIVEDDGFSDRGDSDYLVCDEMAAPTTAKKARVPQKSPKSNTNRTVVYIRDKDGNPRVSVSKDGKVRKMYQQKFQKKWLDMPKFKEWIRESDRGVLYFHCVVCIRDFLGGTRAVRIHQNSRRHIKNMNALKSASSQPYILSMPDVETTSKEEVVHQVFI